MPRRLFTLRPRTTLGALHCLPAAERRATLARGKAKAADVSPLLGFAAVGVIATAATVLSRSIRAIGLPDSPFGVTAGGYTNGAVMGFGLLAWHTVAERLAARHVAAELRSRGLCLHCGYDLRATPAPCPECGAAPSSPAGTV